MPTSWLECNVGPGQFSSEFSVSGTGAGGKGFSLFADARDVEVTKNATDPSAFWSRGRLRVQVLDRRDDLVLVGLPRETLENGRAVTVLSHQLRSA